VERILRYKRGDFIQHAFFGAVLIIDEPVYAQNYHELKFYGFTPAGQIYFFDMFKLFDQIYK